MASWVTTASCSNQRSSMSVLTIFAPISRRCLGKINGLKFFGGRNIGFRNSGKFSTLRSYSLRQPKHLSLTTKQKKPSSRDRQGRWEEPDDGSGNDSDDKKDNIEENDLNLESDWEGETDAETVANYEEELMKG